ncbi:MAG: histidine kinase, partial [bacterium]
MKIKTLNRLSLQVALIIVLSFINLVAAQNNNLKFEHLSIANGLSNSTVNCILKDSRGLMWFGTNDGLNKYDGYQVTIYKNAPENLQSINSYEVMAIMEDIKHNIWIATKRGGLDLYNRETDQITNIVPHNDGKRIVESLYIFCILEDSEEKIWFGTLSGLYNLDRQTNLFTEYLSDTTNTQSLSSDRIHCLFEDSNKRLWIGTSDGLNLFDRETSTFKRYIYNPGTGLPIDIRG